MLIEIHNHDCARICVCIDIYTRFWHIHIYYAHVYSIYPISIFIITNIHIHIFAYVNVYLHFELYDIYIYVCMCIYICYDMLWHVMTRTRPGNTQQPCSWMVIRSQKRCWAGGPAGTICRLGGLPFLFRQIWALGRSWKLQIWASLWKD